MASHDPNPNRTPMYPQVDPYHPSAPPFYSSSSSSLYPTVDMDNLGNLFPSPPSDGYAPSAPPEIVEESHITIPGVIVHLIDRHYSVELAAGDLQIIRLQQGESTVAVFAAVSKDIQWPLTKDLAAVKLDASHYFFSFSPPCEAVGSDSSSEDDGGKKKKKNEKKKKKKKTKDKKKKGEDKKKKESQENDVLNYGLTIVLKGQEGLLKELDGILETSCSFSVQKVDEKAAKVMAEAAAMEISAVEWETDEKKREKLEGQCTAYWTTLAPNVEEYSGTAARLIAMGSGQLVKGILWCGDVTIDRLKWGDEVMRNRMVPGEKKEIDPTTLKRIKRFVRNFIIGFHHTKFVLSQDFAVLLSYLLVFGVFW